MLSDRRSGEVIMRLLGALVGLALIFSPAFADQVSPQPKAGQCTTSVQSDLWLKALLFVKESQPTGLKAVGGCRSSSVSQEAKSGCCSWHGGVCGCDSATGHEQCCDGSDSPSCGC